MEERSDTTNSTTQPEAYIKTFVPEKGQFQFPRVSTIDFEPDTSALVLSPHPDDDIFGCGGTICKFTRKGTKFKIAYMTDGRFGSDSIPPKELIEIRRKEAEDALSVLGCSDFVFLENVDLGLRCDQNNIDKLRYILDDFKPKALFIPSFEDFHPDHVTTNRLAARVLNDYGDEIDCYSYEVMAPVRPNVFVDITEFMDLKIKAMKQHKTQIEVVDYAEKIIGLNSYRSIFAEKHVKYCEAYHKCTRRAFISMAESMGVLV